MLNRNSAIIESYNVGKYPFEDKIEIILSENRNLIIQQIAGWPDDISSIEKSFSEQLGSQKNIDFLPQAYVMDYHRKLINYEKYYFFFFLMCL